MSDPEPPRRRTVSTPQWQQQSPSEPSGTAEPSTTAASRAELLEQASKFLEVDGIREAPAARKAAFLESKGLTNEEVQELIGVSKDTLSNTSDKGPSLSATHEPTQLPSGSGVTSSSPPIPPSQSKHDVPPIVTYPEFLLPPPGQPPLLTARRLFTALYLAGVAAASIYSASIYIITPMTDQLTEARHSLSETAISNLGKLNGKLEGAVSEIPPVKRKQPMGLDDDGDAESVDSDPTECFHVDVGTQTSPAPSRRSSISASISGEYADKDAKAVAQEGCLKTIHSHLSELVEGNNDVGQQETGVISGIQDLKTYLHGLTYSSPYYSNNLYGGPGGAGLGGIRGAEREDESAKMKSEIRGIKSVFLNAKSFPATGNRAGHGAARPGTHWLGESGEGG